MVHSGEYGHYEATVERDGMALAVSSDSAGVDRVTELLPHARRLVTGIAGLHERAVDLMWTDDEDEPPEARERFKSVRPTDLIVCSVPATSSCFEDDGT